MCFWIHKNVVLQLVLIQHNNEVLQYAQYNNLI